ncbi:ABC transporter substrate-binding protein [Halomonas sp. MCCC 1A17488]|uniref:ABC transporter substrate-binding protein n=1 Tax=Billgrantia sulfidoxydans TaxID=2733484 RepID=A0ABX7W6V8_9GAMM|nr:MULTISPECIES: ABC transporter substrate-binding protein [Halomonas]MCE8017995.1 ABC transporter substrate-binding protein [Halomonas sp. MCCC 1A17488]MCG3241328.1 ABC transporter substrate-binding protein [Halomonas sp. MCCC 1A17488]QPP48707.1 ABC transporter substrate-binding protein [Halomonas sp. SS10-MC5]QTP56046.1 ABC transporter substrate-binding protein [Halomonas sulfidoxydans]
MSIHVTRVATILGLCWLALPAAVMALDVRIGYVQWVPDTGPVLSNVTPAPEDAGLRGAELAVDDNNASGRFLDQRYALESHVVESEEQAHAAFEQMLDAGIALFVLRVPAETLMTMADTATGRALLFNAGAQEDSLRTGDCRPHVLHTQPSYAMLTDALAQWLNLRRWQRAFLIAGPTEADRAWADAFRRSAGRFGVRLVADKTWTFDADLRRTASRELPLFTQADDYDVVVVADTRGDFGEYVPFNTWLPRPVVGTQGMTPVAWHRVVESWGAAQLQNRFRELAGRDMNGEDYAAWAGVRSIGTAVTELGAAGHEAIRDFTLSEDFQLAAFKGRRLGYRPWNGQLRQPIPLVHPQGLVIAAPIEGFLHPVTDLDSLGYDAAESDCRLQP